MSIPIQELQSSIQKSIESNTKQVITSVLQENIELIKNTIASEIDQLVSQKIKEYEIVVYVLIGYIVLTLLFLLYISIISTYFLKKIR